MFRVLVLLLDLTSVKCILILIISINANHKELKSVPPTETKSTFGSDTGLNV